MTELLDALTELDRRHREGGLSESGFRRARERLLEDFAWSSGHEPAHGLRDGEASAPRKQESARKRRRRKSRPPPAEPRDAAVQRRGSPALDALLLLIVGVAFSEAAAQFFGNGLPYHRFGGQLVYLPGPGIYALRALETGGDLGGQMLLAVLLTPCYFVIPWGAYRALKKPGGVGQLFAGYTIALRYMVVSAAISFVYLAVLNDYPLNLEEHLAVPGLIGVAALGTPLALVILLRRLASR